MESILAVFDVFLLEAVVNGLLLGGLFALLSLGLNLIFGVIDVVWICYAELIMIGMYTIWWLHVPQGLSLWVAFPAAIALVAVLGGALHHFIIRPVLAAEPINQLLVTGGVLFLLQALATVIFGIDFRNIGVRMPGFSVGDMYLSTARMLAFVVALAAIAATWWFLRKTFTGVAIRLTKCRNQSSVGRSTLSMTRCSTGPRSDSSFNPSSRTASNIVGPSSSGAVGVVPPPAG